MISLRFCTLFPFSFSFPSFFLGGDCWFCSAIRCRFHSYLIVASGGDRHRSSAPTASALFSLLSPPLFFPFPFARSAYLAGVGALHRGFSLSALRDIEARAESVSRMVHPPLPPSFPLPYSRSALGAVKGASISSSSCCFIALRLSPASRGRSA